MTDDRPWRGRRWFVDVEGNGAKVSEIIELGAVETIDLEPTGRILRWMVRPVEPIDWYATKVHGIRNSDVAHLDPIGRWVPDIMAAIDGQPIAGHAVHGDMDIITRDVPGWRPSSAIDSLSIARSLVEKEGGHRLSALLDHFGLRGETVRRAGGKSHSAVYDSMGSALLLRHLRDVTDPKAFDHAFRQGESLARWDTMVRRRVQKVEKAARDAIRHEERRRQAESLRDKDSGR